MRNLLCLILVVFLPLTLASQTQHRFKVYVDVSGDGDDEQAVRTVESHLKRELRLLGDVDIVGESDDWRFRIDIFMITLNYLDGAKTGYSAIGTHYSIRLHEWHYMNPTSYKTIRATQNGVLGAAYYDTQNLPKFCINHVNRFDKQRLAPRRLNPFGDLFDDLLD